LYRVNEKNSQAKKRIAVRNSAMLIGVDRRCIREIFSSAAFPVGF